MIIYNKKTGQLRVVQTTSIINHTVNTIVGGIASKDPSYPIPYYNARFVGLLG